LRAAASAAATAEIPGLVVIAGADHVSRALGVGVPGGARESAIGVDLPERLGGSA